MKLDAVQIRVLGVLLEKQRTTPDVYPLTLNALRTACNQSTNRDPVVAYDEGEVRHALEELGRRRWTRNVGGPRAAKFRHMLGDALNVTPDEQAVLAVLMLRGPQTPGELRQRTARLHVFGDAEELEATIDRLGSRDLVERMERAPGQKEGRVRHLLGGDAGSGAVPAAVGEEAAATGTGESVVAQSAVSDAFDAAIDVVDVVGGPTGEATFDAALATRLERLESQLAELRGQVTALRDELGA